ncbi:MAG: DNA polymerase III subunit alpha [Phycisphaerae bacterium]|nr:DNA polymerase III subunit alpha [Phycisphaerae bacterium]
MIDQQFTHLHVHSEYSLLDGAASVKGLVKQAAAIGMDSLAISDHGNMYGAAAFFSHAKAANIKPIIGIEAYIAPGSRFQKEGLTIGTASYHLLLLAENNVGYQNLLKLSTLGYTEGFYYRPRIDKELLTELHEGLICTSACLGGEIPQLLMEGKEKEAKEAVEWYLKLFGPERYFVEIQWHCEDQNRVTPMLVDLANRCGAPIVATNDVHFLTAADYKAHDALTCLSTGKLINDERRMKYPPELYLRPASEMNKLFMRWPEACKNTRWIADRCNVDIDFSTQHAPVYQPPENKTADEYLRELCIEGLHDHLGEEIPDHYMKRLDRELEVISSKDFSSYFLIVWDFVNYARQNNIPANPRGSGVGTLVGYALKIAFVDPLEYGLLFERFMDPERNEMPDIDIDICQDGRQRVIDYMREKYGHVAQITTFGTLKAKGVIRDVCRVLNIPLDEADKMAKLIPDGLKITLQDALDQEPRLKEWYDADERVREVFEIAQRLEGLTRHCSVHACAVVIADEPLTNFLPLYKQTGSDDLITQFEGPLVEKVGLLKMDCLGLRTLSIIQKTRDLVKVGKGLDIDQNKIDLKDKATLQTFCDGRTKGVFQFESGGMRDLLQSMKPDRIQDLIAANALYRPGPMALIPDYNARKHGTPYENPHPIMDPILEETYGIMIYQEQVMQILNQLGSLPLARAYKLIKAIGKKKLDIINAESSAFMDGCVENGIDRKQAEELFALIMKFAGYGFNKSHSTQYAILAFQTAYFKTHYPTEFMAALLTYEMGTTEKVAEYIDDCRSIGINVLPPDINESFTDFTVIYNEKTDTEKSEKTDDGKPDLSGESIRFGLAAVKGVGTKAVENLILVRQEQGAFTSIYDLCQKIDSRAVNRGALEALIKAGAMDSFSGSRPQLIAALDDATKIASKLQKDKAMGQMNLFGAFDEHEEDDKVINKLPDVAPWTESEMLKQEKSVLGLYVTSHPLAQYAPVIYRHSTANTETIKDMSADTEVLIGGILTRVRQCVTKKGKGAGSRMAMITLEDLHGTIDGVAFPSVFALNEDMLHVDAMVFIKGTIDRRREEPSICVNDIYNMTRADEELTNAVNIKLEPQHITDNTLSELNRICQDHRGKTVVYAAVNTSNDEMKAIIKLKSSVRPDADFCRKIENILGKNNVILKGYNEKTPA